METIEKKAHVYAKKAFDALAFYSQTVITDYIIKNAIEQAYLQCYNDMMAMPLAERLTQNECEHIKIIYQTAFDFHSINGLSGGKSIMIALEEIFGSDFFKEGGKYFIEFTLKHSKKRR